MLDYQFLIPLLKQTALEAGEKIMQIYHSENFDIELKSDDSPVTRADLLAHKIIFDNLKNTDFPILSEEGNSISYKERKNWETLWIVDPIDGTKEFIKKNDEFTVNIALVHQNQPVLGVVYAPAFDKLYYGGLGNGAYLQKHNQTPEKLEIKERTKGPIRIAASRSHINKKTKEFIDSIQEETKAIPIGSSLKFMLVAENKIDLYPRFSPCMEWDTAAAHAILRGMGIEVISMENEKPLHYNKRSLYNPYFMVKHEFIDINSINLDD